MLYFVDSCFNLRDRLGPMVKDLKTLYFSLRPNSISYYNSSCLLGPKAKKCQKCCDFNVNLNVRMYQISFRRKPCKCNPQRAKILQLQPPSKRKMPEYLVLMESKMFLVAFAVEKTPMYPFYLFIAVLRNNFSGNWTKNTSAGYTFFAFYFLCVNILSEKW